MWTPVKAWLRKRFPLKRPWIANINVLWVTEALAEQGSRAIAVPLLAPPHVLPVKSLDSVELADRVWEPPLCPESHAAWHDQLVILRPPIPEASFVDVNVPYPPLMDMFTGLVQPGRAGKAYREQAQESPSEHRPTTAETVQAADRQCKHGLIEYTCALCNPEPVSKRYTRSLGATWTRPAYPGERAATIDVFDLLLPYLQPPLELILAVPERVVRVFNGLRPYQYQVEGAKFLAERTGALLGDEMGLGKTMQAILALQMLFSRGEVRRALILCRRTLLSVWESEFAKWAPDIYVLKVRGARWERERLWQTPAPVYLTTYETLREDIRRIPSLRTQFDIVILDEVQEIKNAEAKKSRAVRSVQAKYRWGLSGTPLENRVEDVVSIFRYLEPRAFPQSTPVYSWEPPSTVRERIRPYILRRRARDVLKELPEKVVNEVWLDLTPKQRKAYEAMYSQARDDLRRPGVTRVHVFRWITELKKICNLDPDSGESCKLDYLKEQLDDIVESGDKALVFSHFPNETLRRILPALHPFDPAIFDGSLSERERKNLIDRFQNEPSPKVLLMSVQVGGVGITLTRANHVFHFDHWWNPAVAQQAAGRAHRIGQTRTVFVYDIYTRGTIEERVYRLLKEKETLFQKVIDDLSVPGVQKAISDEELFALFDLEVPEHLRRPMPTPENNERP